MKQVKEKGKNDPHRLPFILELWRVIFETPPGRICSKGLVLPNSGNPFT
jgi:hypothetical protein